MKSVTTLEIGQLADYSYICKIREKMHTLESTMLRLFVLLLGLLAGAQSPAHEVDVCLASLAQIAAGFKACMVQQQQETQCQAIEQRMQAKVEQCRDEHFTEASIAGAMSSGAAEVEGDPGQSPYQRSQLQARWEFTQMKPNVDRFKRVFPDYPEFGSALTERFATAACPKSYEGSTQRWIYIATLKMLRYSLHKDDMDEPVSKTLDFFAPEAAGKCYPVEQDEGLQAARIVNLPDHFLDQIERHSSIVKCDSPDCGSEQAAASGLFQQYQTQYRRYRQLMICADYAQRNRTRNVLKQKGGSAVSLPEYCPATEQEVALLNAQGLVEDLDQRLFQSPNVLINVTKSE